MDKVISYDAWKDEKSINLVCEQLLDNANMDIEIGSCPFSLTVTFYVIGSDIKVTFRCRSIERFDLRKDGDAEAMFVVLETHVRHITSDSDKREQWSISILPEAQINIECNSFEWSIEQMSDAERNM